VLRAPDSLTARFHTIAARRSIFLKLFAIRNLSRGGRLPVSQSRLRCAIVNHRGKVVAAVGVSLRFSRPLFERQSLKCGSQYAVVRR